MREVYLLRHAERDSAGVLTEKGQKIVSELKKKFPSFAKVISSESERAFITAKLLAGVNPKIDTRAGFYEPAEKNSRAIYEYGLANNISFFDAAEFFHGGELSEGIHKYALGLNDLVDETLSSLQDNESALIISHDLTIATAMSLRGLPKASSGYLNGYRINSERGISKVTV